MFLNLDCREAFYGGAAGGGKSDALLMAALQYVDVPGYNALLLRRTFTDLSQPGALMDRADKWLGPTVAKKQAGGRRWLFPSGARLTFGHVQNYREAEQQFSSAEYQFIGIDELTQGWGEQTYLFLFSRIRRPRMNCKVCRRPIEWRSEAEMWDHVRQGWCERPIPMDLPSAPDGVNLANVPIRMRSASNPGGSGHIWVRDRFVDPETREPTAVFVPARLDDNPHLDQEEYETNLRLQGGVLTARLLQGNWEIVENDMFMREWFQYSVGAPPGTEWLRYWDLASTTAGDATAGALLGIHRASGCWYLADMTTMNERPLGVQKAVVSIAASDNDGTYGHVPIYIEQEPGSSGVFTMDNFRTLLAGYDFHPDRPGGNKTERARGFSAAAEAGRFFIVATEGENGRPIPPAWARHFLDEAETFPAGEHDDQVDAVTGAMKILTKGAKRRARSSSVAGRRLGH